MIIAQYNQARWELLPALANRQGLITGATGTGKTITLQAITEAFSRQGVPVFMADIKGDLGGISQTGHFGKKMSQVLKERGIDLPAPHACPTTLWDVFGDQGQPVRATSLMACIYEKTLDRESAFEHLKAHAEQRQSQAASAKADGGEGSAVKGLLLGRTGPRGGQHDGLVQTMTKPVVRTIGSSIGRHILHGILGGIMGG